MVDFKFLTMDSAQSYIKAHHIPGVIPVKRDGFWVVTVENDRHPPYDALPEDILDEAKRITTADRGRDYGHPLDNFTQIAEMWSAYKKVPFTAREVAWMCILMKSSRDSHSPKRDNLVDAAGYARCAQMAEEEKIRREAK